MRLDPAARTALAAAGVLFFLAGAGWAYFRTHIFVTTLMTGPSYRCL